MPVTVKQGDSRIARPWYQDCVSAVSFLLLALLLGKTVARALGPFAGLLFLALTAGTAWHFGKLAWRGLLGDRTSGPR